MLDPQLRAQLERHWEYSGKDEDIAHEVYAEGAVLEFPQGGERFEGVENFREWRRQYPAHVAFKVRRMNRWGDLVVAELLISYDGAPPLYTVNLLELNADNKIAHERIYIMEGWEAPDWRAPWRSDTAADSVSWD
ncbi:MAG TPA: nuclear transport factor 2 family protein [Acidimicrobiia bacterium]|nr:nuclear transport factor 2 family protein [Acidimicrobiia bacterium]